MLRSPALPTTPIMLQQEVSKALQVYVWARRNPYMTLSFLGIFNFTAPYLPWVLLGFSILLRSSPIVDLLGIAVGKPSSSQRLWLCAFLDLLLLVITQSSNLSL